MVSVKGSEFAWPPRLLTSPKENHLTTQTHNEHSTIVRNAARGLAKAGNRLHNNHA
jgi:hypothetical protein